MTFLLGCFEVVSLGWWKTWIAVAQRRSPQFGAVHLVTALHRVAKAPDGAEEGMDGGAWRFILCSLVGCNTRDLLLYRLNIQVERGGGWGVFLHSFPNSELSEQSEPCRWWARRSSRICCRRFMRRFATSLRGICPTPRGLWPLWRCSARRSGRRPARRPPRRARFGTRRTRPTARGPRPPAS